MSGWRVIDCSGAQISLRSTRGQIRAKFEETGRETQIPTADVAILLVGPGTSIGPGVLQRCCDDDVTILVCDWRGIPQGAISATSQHTLVGRRQTCQSNAPVPLRKRAWQSLVKAKITGQARVLKLLGSQASDRLLEIASSVRSGDPDNSEATAARVYWQHWALDRNFSRQPGIQSDEINSCLDYGYAILRGHSIRAVMSAGLNPAIGVFHHGRSNAFNLADDLIEPYRPVIDWAVSKLPQHDLSDPETKHLLVGAAHAVFDSAGLTVPSHMVDTAQHLGAYFEIGKASGFSCESWTAPIETGT